jgi:hypothetical protein
MAAIRKWKRKVGATAENIDWAESSRDGGPLANV